MQEPSDLDLIERLGSADVAVRQSAFDALFRRHERRAYDLAYRVLGDTGLAADAVQEAFLTVYRKAAAFEARAKFTSWLHRVVVNQAIDLRRRRRRYPRLSLGGAGAGSEDERSVPEPAAAGGSGPFAAVLEGERVELVRRAILELSPKLAEVIVLRYPESRSYEEIGEILGVPAGTVKSRLNRAHAALRGILGHHLDDDPGRADTIS